MKTRAWLEEKAGVSTKFVWVNGFSFANLCMKKTRQKEKNIFHLWPVREVYVGPNQERKVTYLAQPTNQPTNQPSVQLLHFGVSLTFARCLVLVLALNGNGRTPVAISQFSHPINFEVKPNPRLVYATSLVFIDEASKGGDILGHLPFTVNVYPQTPFIFIH